VVLESVRTSLDVQHSNGGVIHVQNEGLLIGGVMLVMDGLGLLPLGAHDEDDVGAGRGKGVGMEVHSPDNRDANLLGHGCL
jgi:hypothetical protein